MKRSKKSLLKSILSIVLISTLVSGAVPLDAFVTEARAKSSKTVRYTIEEELNVKMFRLKGNDGTQTEYYPIYLERNEADFSMGDDVTIGIKATDGKNLYVLKADADEQESGFQNSSLSITVTSRTDYITKIVLNGWREINHGEKYSQTKKTVYTESRSCTVDWSDLGALTRITVYYSDTDPSTFTQYNINYILNGGTNSPNNPDKYRVGQDLTLEDPTRGGYEFWYWINEDGQRTEGFPTGTQGDQTFEAVWSSSTIWYTITYDLAGGTLGDEETNPSEYNVESNPITFIDPTRKGFSFLGWTGSNGDAPETPLIIPTGSYGNKSYTANWKKNSYSITCQSGEGGNLSSDKTTAQTGDTVTLTATPGAGLSALLSVSYTDGNETKYAAVTSIGDNKYTFTMPPGNVTANAEFSDGMSYVDENGVGHKLTDSFSEIGSGLADGWYYARGKKPIPDRISISGDVKLILCDGAVLSVPKGIQLTGDNKLTIYGQTAGTGSLTINGVDENNAGIGSEIRGTCGTLVINGGVINVNGGKTGAGIGGGNMGHGGSITINGGSVTATGGEDWNGDGAAGIGGGSHGNSGSITINGGNVKAIGKYAGAGIGSGHYASDIATVIINGGTVEAHGGSYGVMSGAGIGGGHNCSGNVIINGGNVTATNGIGGGLKAGGLKAGGTVQLGWTQLSDFIKSDYYRVTGTVTLNRNFLLDGTETIAAADNIAGKKIVPTTLTTYTVKFDANSDDATGVMEDMRFLSGKAQALTKNTFTREHYYFDGWNTASDGSGVSYSDGQTVNNLSNTDGEEITLYARWKAVDYDITFDSMTNGYVYAKTGNSQYVNSAHYNDTVTLVITPDDGYAPETLKITPEDGIETEVEETGGVYSFSMPDKAVKVKASFKQHVHHFTYEANGASIRAKCDAAYCALTNSEAYLTISAPEDTVYDGTAKAAAVTGTIPGVDTPAITYKKEGADFNGTPVEEGTYTASITLNGVTASVTYTITMTPVAKYKVTVNNGSGTGSYEEGATVTITANVAPEGMEFEKWTGTEGLYFTSGSGKTATASFTMPKKDLSVTAVNTEKKEEKAEAEGKEKKEEKSDTEEKGKKEEKSDVEEKGKKEEKSDVEEKGKKEESAEEEEKGKEEEKKEEKIEEEKTEEEKTEEEREAEEKAPVKKPDRVPFTESGETYASSNDNFAAYAPGSENGTGGKITELILDFSRVGESSVSPSDLRMTIISGSKFTTKQPLKDKDSFTADKGIKVKVNKNTLIPSITVKKDGKLTLTLSDGNTYSVTFKSEKPKAEKKEKKQKKGSGILTRSVSDLFGTSIDSGKLSVTSKEGKAEVSGNTIVFDTTENDSLKVLYKYLDKKYKMTIKIK